MKTKIIVKNRNSKMSPIMQQNLKKFLRRIQLNTIQLYQSECTGLYIFSLYKRKLISVCLEIGIDNIIKFLVREIMAKVDYQLRKQKCRGPYRRYILGLLNVYCHLSAVCSYESNEEGQLECIFWPTCFLLSCPQDLSHKGNKFFVF